MSQSINTLASGALLLAAAACSSPKPVVADAARATGTVYTVKDTTVQASLEASGTATPIQQATLSTKLMGTVLDVLVREGDVVSAGQALVRIDARDLAARRSQVNASIADADAMHRDAVTQAGRMRALYADSAATRAQLDAAETGLARAEAAVSAAHAASAEVDAMSNYAVVRAPFSGVVTKRFVDPGAFAAPGAPLVSVQDGRQLRITVNATPDAVRNLRRGQAIGALIENNPVRAVIEGTVPSDAGNLYTVNALVANADGRILPGSTATLLLPTGMHSALVVPSRAIVRQGDLTGVMIRTNEGDETRWIRLGPATGDVVEVNAGLRAGDQVVVPPVAADVAERN